MLGVSELVTNALLHARGEITVRITDSTGRLRIEVYDGSPESVEQELTVTVDHDTNPATVGRGLKILDSISFAWGVYSEPLGKCVWFQPISVGLPTRHGGGPVMAAVLPGPAASSDDVVHVELRDLPAVLFAHYRTRMHDLRREMTLISLGDRAGMRHGHALVDTTREHAYRVHYQDMIRQIDDAIAVGLDRIDVHLDVERSVLAELEDVHDELVELNDFCRDSKLLTLEAGPQEQAMRAWYISELRRQAAGLPPTPWGGGYEVTDPDPLRA